MTLLDSNTFIEPTAATSISTARTQFNNALRSLLTNFAGAAAPSLSGSNIVRSGAAQAPETGLLYRHSNANVTAFFVADANHVKTQTVGTGFTRVGIGHRLENGIVSMMSNVSHYEIGELAATVSSAGGLSANARLYLKKANTDTATDFVDIGIPPLNGSVTNAMIEATTSTTTGITGDRLNFAFNSTKGLAGANAQIKVSAIANNPTAIALGTINSANTSIVHYGTTSGAIAGAGKDGLNILTQDGKTYGNVAARVLSQATIMNTATDVAPLMPPGTIIMYGADSAPAGWLGCEGGTVSRTTYAALFAVIGTNFGAGDGSSTFTLPNFNDRVAAGKATNVGYSPSGTTIGSSGVLTAAGGALSLSVGTSSVATASKDAGSSTVVTSVNGSTGSITVTQAFQGVKFIIKT